MKTREELENMFNEAAAKAVADEPEQVADGYETNTTEPIPQEYADLFTMPTESVVDNNVADVPHNQNQELNASNGEVQQYVEMLRQQHQQAVSDASYYRGVAEAQANIQSNTVQQSKAPIASEYDLTEEETAFLGENRTLLQKVVGRITHEESQKTQAKLEAFEQRFAQLQESQVQVQAAAISNDFRSKVKEFSPGYETVLRTPAWTKYIKEIDPEHGVPRGQVIDHYGKSNNARAVAYHINKVKESMKEVTKQPSPVGRTAGFAVPATLNQRPTLNMAKVVGEEGLMAQLKAGKITREQYKKNLEAVYSFN